MARYVVGCVDKFGYPRLYGERYSGRIAEFYPLNSRMDADNLKDDIKGGKIYKLVEVKSKGRKK